MKPAAWRRFLDQCAQWFEPVTTNPWDLVSKRERENIINQVRQEMRKGRFVTAKQACAVLYTAKVIPSYCFCTYCWNEVPEEPEGKRNKKSAAAGGEPLPRYKKRENGEMNLADRIFLPCQHMV